MSEVSTISVLEPALAALTGAIDIDATPAGHVPLRLARASLPNVSDPLLSALARIPAGVRLRLRSDAPWLEFSCQLTVVGTSTGIQPAVFEVVTEGISTASITSTEGNVFIVSVNGRGIESYQPGAATIVRLPLDDSGSMTSYEIWLPPASQIAIQDIVIPAGTTLEAEPDRRARWIHHGSSISHCLNATKPSQAWPSIAAARLGSSITNLGFAGQCQLDQVVAQTIRDTPCDLISLELGVNIVNGDTMRERTFSSAVHGFLDTIRDGHPDTPVVIISPIACPLIETEPGPTQIGPDGQVVRIDRPESLAVGSLSLQRIRQLLEAVVTLRRTNGDENLYGLTGLDIFGMDDVAFLLDGLHPSPDAWLMMGERTATLIGGLGLLTS